MREFNIESFGNFIKETLFQTMTIDDYILVIDELFDIKPTKITATYITYHSFCHNVNPREIGRAHV